MAGPLMAHQSEFILFLSCNTVLFGDIFRGYTHVVPFKLTDQAAFHQTVYNLFGIARDDEDAEQMRRYMDTLTAVVPDEDRYLWFRAVLNFQTDRRADALADVEALLERPSLSVDRGQVRELQQVLESGDE